MSGRQPQGVTGTRTRVSSCSRIFDMDIYTYRSTSPYTHMYSVILYGAVHSGLMYCMYCSVCMFANVTGKHRPATRACVRACPCHVPCGQWPVATSSFWCAVRTCRHDEPRKSSFIQPRPSRATRHLHPHPQLLRLSHRNSVHLAPCTSFISSNTSRPSN